MQGKRYIGVSVPRDWVDIAFADEPEQAVRIANAAEAPGAWATALDPARIGLVAFEPTGGLERTLRNALVKAGVAFARVHPNEVAAFRASRGVKAKTDRINAALLARFARDELGRLSGKEIVALTGLAPRTWGSGKAKGRAVTGQGRPEVRQVLFQAARCAIRWNPAITL